MRLTRTSMLEVLRTEYIRLARIKGLSEWVIIWKHGFKNAALPVLTFAVLLFVMMLGGAVVTETVFAWPARDQLGNLAGLSCSSSGRSLFEYALYLCESVGGHLICLLEPEDSVWRLRSKMER